MSIDSHNEAKFQSNSLISNQSDHELAKSKKGVNKSNTRKRQLTNGSPSFLFNDCQSVKSATNSTSPTISPFTITIEINFIAWLLFLIALLFRIYLIGYPPNIVCVIIVALFKA